MTKGHRTIVALLAVVAVLLGLNLIVGGSTPAAAQGQGMGPPPQAVAMHLRLEEFTGTVLYRLWSDGTVERNEQVLPDCCYCHPHQSTGWQVVPEQPFLGRNVADG